ncbi:uncharacterized protein LOC116291432 [Actinia tenebrosa]|uniref:Uncharacterized protein LOC116291432 n=1 Tax=Actinia tenebrosa TaxID=6105 RepID=A0A6P8HDH8_ACTTE|nr:uncharacterized protein LOC116291432 [Actinia tenebrosa]
MARYVSTKKRNFVNCISITNCSYIKEFELIDCSSKGLVSVPHFKGFQKRARSLTLKNNFITDVNISRIKTQLPLIRQINLHKNPLRCTNNICNFVILKTDCDCPHPAIFPTIFSQSSSTTTYRFKPVKTTKTVESSLTTSERFKSTKTTTSVLSTAESSITSGRFKSTKTTTSVLSTVESVTTNGRFNHTRNTTAVSSTVASTNASTRIRISSDILYFIIFFPSLGSVLLIMLIYTLIIKFRRNTALDEVIELNQIDNPMINIDDEDDEVTVYEHPLIAHNSENTQNVSRI